MNRLLLLLYFPGLALALKAIGTNVTLWLMVLSSAALATFSATANANVAKYLVYQFGFSVSRASLGLGKTSSPSKYEWPSGAKNV